MSSSLLETPLSAPTELIPERHIFAPAGRYPRLMPEAALYRATGNQLAEESAWRDDT